MLSEQQVQTEKRELRKHRRSKDALGLADLNQIANGELLPLGTRERSNNSNDDTHDRPLPERKRRSGRETVHKKGTNRCSQEIRRRRRNARETTSEPGVAGHAMVHTRLQGICVE